MKTLSLLFLILTQLFLSSSVFAEDDYSSFEPAIDKYDFSPPIPHDDDVIISFGRASRKQLPPKKWSFLVWNLHKGVDATFRPEYLALTFGREIIMNQEILLNDFMYDVFNFLPFHYFESGTSFFSGPERYRTGVANISTVAPIFTKFIRTTTLEPIVGTPKLSLITSYPILLSRKNLTVVNIHGINFVSTFAFQKELSRIYHQIKDIPSPMVFAGDFNTWNPERINILKMYIKKLKLKEANFLPDNRTTFNKFPLDHFFHSSDIKVTKARADSLYIGSDHKPLTVEVEYIRSKGDEESTQDDLEVDMADTVF